MVMKKIMFLVSILLAFAFTKTDTAIKSTSVVISPKSSLMVKGSTNINNFKCIYDIEKFNSPIPVIYYLSNGKLKFKETVLILENKCFDCGGRAINKDFQKILKTESYPQIKMFLKQVNGYDLNKSLEALVDLEIAGVKKPYTIKVNISKENDLTINGGLKINLKDFNIESPKKLFGIIKIDEIIEIDFSLLVKES